MILLQIIIISLLVFAIHYTMLPGEIFGFIEKWWKKMEDELLLIADKYLGHAKELTQRARNAADYATIEVDERRANLFFKKQQRLEKLSQPLFRCPVCMAPYYGTALYWLIPWPRIGLPTHDWAAWPIIIIAVLGLNSIIVRFFKDAE